MNENVTGSEDYEGSDLLTIKRLAERLRIENSHGLQDQLKKLNTTKYHQVTGNRADAKLSYKDIVSSSSKVPFRSQPRKRRQLLKPRQSVLLTREALESIHRKSVGQANIPDNTNEDSSIKKTASKFLFGFIQSLKTEQKIKEIARGKFRWAIKIVWIWTQYLNSVLDKAMKQQKNHLDSLRSLQEIHDSLKSQDNELGFDKYYFVANKDIELTAESQRLLSIDPALRSEENVLQVMYGLNALSSFNDYPVHLKKKLCTVAYFRRIESNRVIVRQGHQAEYFYFIVSGSAIVTIAAKSQVRTVNKLYQGSSFGELALLHHSTRTASVVSVTSMQLLAIERGDFFKIFLSSSLALDAESGLYCKYPEHVLFLKQHDLFKNYDIDEFMEHPEICLIHFYKNNTIVCADDQSSQWVFVIKSGMCTVVKEVKVPIEKHIGHFQQTPNSTPINGLPKLDSTMSMRDVQFRALHCYDNYTFVPTPLNAAAGEQKSLTKYIWREKTSILPGDYFYLKKKENTIFEDDEIDEDTGHKADTPERSFSVFLKLHEMGTGDTTGFSSLAFAPEDEFRIKEMAPITMISNRAEIILISKKFLISKCSDQFKDDIRNKIHFYPSESAFLQKLNTQTHWEKYRFQRYKSTVSKLE